MRKILATVVAGLAVYSQLYAQAGDRCEGAGGVHVDGGIYENGHQCVQGDCYFVQLLTPISYPSRLTKACICWMTVGGTSQSYDLVVFDDDGIDGQPGTRLGSKAVTLTEAASYGDYYGYACADLNAFVQSGGVYIGPRWSTLPPNPSADFFVCSDIRGSTPLAEAYQSNSGTSWIDLTRPGSISALGIRAEFEHSECVPSETTACLLAGRFRVEVEWTDFSSVTRDALVSSASTSDTALFYWTNAVNLELLIKGIDACSFNNKFWIYFAAATNVGYRVTVTDTHAGGEPKVYTNPVGTVPQATTDISAFDCP